MAKRFHQGIFCGAVAVSLMAPTLHAAITTLLSDSLLGTGPLAGSAPNIAGTGTWTTYYNDNGGELTPSAQTDTTGAGFSALTASNPTGSNLPVDGQRSSTGVNVGGSTSHTDDGAYIGFTAASTGLITATDSFVFPNTAASGNPTAWGFLALLQGSYGSSAPDVINNTAFVGPWALVRPASNGSDVVEIYATGGTGHQIVNVNTDGSSPHVIQLQLDPAAGTLDATVDGTELLSTPYSYAAASLAVPVADGVEFGDRTNTGLATNAAPSTAFFTSVSVTQAVPEPASLGVLAIGGLFGLRRRRSPQSL